MKSDVEVRVYDLVCKQFGAKYETLTREKSFAQDLGADSLDANELILELEEEFDVKIPDDEADKFRTVGDVIAYLENLPDEEVK